MTLPAPAAGRVRAALHLALPGFGGSVTHDLIRYDLAEPASTSGLHSSTSRFLVPVRFGRTGLWRGLFVDLHFDGDRVSMMPADGVASVRELIGGDHDDEPPAPETDEDPLTVPVNYGPRPVGRAA